MLVNSCEEPDILTIDESEKDVSKSTRNKNVLKIEQRLTHLVDTDINNPEIYELLKQLAKIYIYTNKYTYGYQGVDDVCHDVAADVYMSLLNGKRIGAWIYYIGKMIKLTYVSRQRKIEHEVIETDGNPQLRHAVERMCSGSHVSTLEELNSVNRNVVLENIDIIIRKTLSKTKFKEGSKDWLLLYMNVSLTLYNTLIGRRKTKKCYFRLPEHLKCYIPIIINQFYIEFSESGFTDSVVSEDIDSNIMSIVMDEVIMKECKKNKGCE